MRLNLRLFDKFDQIAFTNKPVNLVLRTMIKIFDQTDILKEMMNEIQILDKGY